MSRILGSFILDLEDEPFICYGDEAFFHLTGHSVEELAAAEQLLTAARLPLEALRQGEQSAFPLSLTCKDGTVQTVYAFATPSRHPETGRSICVFSLAGLPPQGSDLDPESSAIHEIRQAKAELARSHRTLETITGSVDCAIVKLAVTQNGLEMVFVNDKYYQMVGYTPAELEAMGPCAFSACIHPGDRAAVTSRILEDKLDDGFEARFLTKSGPSFWATIRSHRIEGEGAEAYLCTFQNIDHLKQIEQELTISNNRYRVLLSNLADLYFEIDLTRDILYRASPGSRRYLVQEATVDIPRSFIESGFILPDFAGEAEAVYRAMKEGKPQAGAVLRCRRQSGEIVWVEITLYNTFDSGGQPIRALGFLRDVTGQKEQELRFAGEEQYLGSMIKTSVAVITFSLRDERLISYYHNGEEARNQRGDHSLQANMYLIAQTKVHPEDRAKMLEFYSAGRIALSWGKADSGGEQLDFRMRRDVGGPYIWVRSTLTVLRAPANDELICFSYIQDVNRQKEAELELLKRAESDSLTSLYNREAIRTKVNAFLSGERQNGKIHALIYLDLDGFKQVNDGYGHRAGDAVLVDLADKLRASTRTSDFVARLGGDEYAVFLKNADDIHVIVHKAKQLCALGVTLNVEGSDSRFLSASVGVAIAPTHGMDFDTLYNKADKAMYTAKERGKNRVAIYQADELGLEEDIVQSSRAVYVDKLTGYGNYERFTQDVEKLLSRQGEENYALIFCDIRHFSAINDQLGYEGGNRVLKQLATHLEGLCGHEETFARVWGDQFVLLLGYRRAGDLLSRFRDSAECGFGIEHEEGNRFAVDICAGAYCIESEADIASVSEMLDRANIAQKSIKNVAGTNLVFYTEAMREKILFEQLIERDMVAALQNRELEVYYQPRIDIIRGNSLSGMEALVRWNHPEKGLLVPGHFMEVFERSGFITQVDEFVLHEVCCQLQRQQEASQPSVPISVNVSRMSLYAHDFVPRYTAIRDEYGISPRLVELEFSEGIIYDNLSLFTQVVLELKKAGFACAVDNFGSSVTTMNMLRDLPVDNIKIDRQFLDATDAGEARRDTVLSSVIQLAQKLGMRIVTEGVEHAGQVDALRDMGCDYVQGYVYSQPMPWDSLVREMGKSAQVRLNQETAE